MKKLWILALSLLLCLPGCVGAPPEETTAKPVETTAAEPPVTTVAEESFHGLAVACLQDGALYKIRSVSATDSSEFVLTCKEFGVVDNSSVLLSAYEADLSQVWRACENADGSYRLENMASRLSLTTDNAETVEKQQYLTACLAGTNDGAKNWQIYSADDAHCVIKNAASSMVVTAVDGYACRADYVGSAEQQWSLEKLSDGDGEYPYLLVLSGDYTGDASCPEILYKDGVYYNYNQAKTIAVKSSTDLIHWTRLADGYALSEYPAWFMEVSGKNAIWAPGCYKIGDKYYLYYATSSLGSRNSGIGVAVCDDPAKNDWEDLGLVIRSQAGSVYNAIDPNIFIDEDGTVYLLFGSYWTGIYMTKINPETGKRDETDETLYHLARGKSDMEAPYLIKHGDYYYLFVARGGLRKGTYYWAVGRSESVTGPYVDKDGVPMLSGRGGTRLTEWKSGVCGVGHAQYFEDTDGTGYMVAESWLHTFVRDEVRLHISKIVWTEDGWPVTVLDPDVLGALE